MQLLSRSWTIIDGRGTVHEVVGEGVVGEMPLIAPGASFDYVSGCPLDTSSGAMSGSYRMVDEDGAAFDVAIPDSSSSAPDKAAADPWLNEVPCEAVIRNRVARRATAPTQSVMFTAVSIFSNSCWHSSSGTGRSVRLENSCSSSLAT